MRPDLAEVSNAKIALPASRWSLSGLRQGGLLHFDDGCGDPAMEAVPGAFTTVETGQPLLSGEGLERLLLRGARHFRDGPAEILANDQFMVGAAQLPANPADMEEVAHRVYSCILDQVGDRSIYRFWNFVPNINLVAKPLLENYKLFCTGRARAFAEHFGENPTTHFPSASATGTLVNRLSVIFLAGYPKVENWENPEQTPAYEYPEEYGPQPPSFARASRFVDPEGREWVFIAGTAAIKGCETQCVGDFKRQLEITLDNMRLTLEEDGMSLVKGPAGSRRFFKVFLRDRGNLPALQDQMSGLLGPGDHCTVVEADICRRDLEVEIELSVVPQP